MQLQRPDPVSAEAAYRAAEGRALRTMRALILAEARIADLTQQLAVARAVADDKEEEIVSLGGRSTDDSAAASWPRTAQCWHTEPDTSCDWNICRQQGGGEHGADAVPAGYTEPVGQAD